MPTEHEYKFVIDNKSFGDYYQNNLEILKHDKHLVIEQGYLAFSKGMTTRIRSIIRRGKSTRKKWYLTFKQKVRNRVIEIETKLDQRDGEELWGVCVGKVFKDRFVFYEHNGTWELDFFRKGTHRYFTLAEVELEEGAPRPGPPEWLRNHILYEVPLTDDRFSNKRLGDVEYAQRIYQEITEDKDVEA